MYENQFIQFTDSIDPQECGMPLPVVFGGKGIAFFAPVNEYTKTIFAIVDAQGVPFKNGNGDILSGSFRNMAGNYVRAMFAGDEVEEEIYTSGYALFSAATARDFVAPNECFRIRIGIPTSSRSWVETSYPFKNYDSVSEAFEALGLETYLFDAGNNIVINTTEVQSYAVLAGMAQSEAIVKHTHVLYYTIDTGKYYVWDDQSDTFLNIDDTAQICDLFGESARESTILLSSGISTLIDKDLDSGAHQILWNAKRTEYLEVHITGNLMSGHTFGSTAGRIIAKYRGVTYESDEYREYMEGIAENGGATFTRVSRSDYNMLVSCGIECSITNITFEHTFSHAALNIDSVGDRYLYRTECVLYLSPVSYTYAYSNLLRRYENADGLSMLTYYCGTTTFDLPFTSERAIRQWLPIMANDPTPEQKDEVYEKLSGERVVMFATINEKYKCETDYIPYEWHKRIVMALSCDVVYINDERLTKSDAYEIDWENYSKLDCGTKITRAEWKMVANVTSRNSNN